MTGYGKGQLSDSFGVISIEIKSLNHRYFDFSAKVPRGYVFLEEKLKDIVRKKVIRGKCDVILNVEGFDHLENVCVNNEVADAYFNALVDLKRQYNLVDEISISLLSRFPDVLVADKLELDEGLFTSKVENVLNLALDDLIMMRKREGQMLKIDIGSRLDLVLSIVNDIEHRIPDILNSYKYKLKQNINDFINDEKLVIDENRILTEIAIFADKIAVDEETVRIKSHIDQFRNLLESDGEVGRRMDFLVQELNREVNTIGSKVQDVNISSMIVELKVQLEKIREQVQNIE